MTAMTEVTCYRCGRDDRLRDEVAAKYELGQPGHGTYECPVCRSLGGRALVPLLRNPTPEAFAAFWASPPGSVLFNVGLVRRGLPQYGADFTPKVKGPGR